MKKVSIICCEHTVASNITGPIDIFNIANTIAIEYFNMGSEPIFECKIFSPDGKPVKTSVGLELSVNGDAHDFAHYDSDIVIICGQHYSNREGMLSCLNTMSIFTPYIIAKHNEDKLIASFCTGTFTLAQTGLLDQKSATTCWWLADSFQKHFPNIRLDLERLVIREGNLFTSGATSSYQDLCIQLVKLLSDDALACALGKVLLVDNHRQSQLPFMFQQQNRIQHHDKKILEAQTWMKDNISTSLPLDDLATKFAMSKRTFIRRFKQATGETPTNHWQSIRIDIAKQLLESTPLSIEEIVEKVGYSDSSTFRKLFQRTTQLTPKAYRTRFTQASLA